MLQRQPIQARYEFEIPGITNEVCFSDIRLANDNDDDSAAARLDRIQFQAQGGNIGETSDGDGHIDSGETELLGLPEPVIEMDDIDGNNMNLLNHVMLEQAVANLTDKQTIALWLWVNGRPERWAADYMGVKQATYQEMLWGKSGVGGAIPKLRKYFQKHPVTQSSVWGC